MIALDARPRLAPKVRLRFDAKSGKHLLLYPEKGMQLNGTAADIVQLCQGELSVREIIRALSERYPQQAPELIEREVLSFLASLSERALIRTAP